jgi:hypothetical protein
MVITGKHVHGNTQVRKRARLCVCRARLEVGLAAFFGANDYYSEKSESHTAGKAGGQMGLGAGGRHRQPVA